MLRLKEMESITKEEFEAFEAVRRSGVLNMWDSQVCDLAGFDKDTHVSIIHHYTALMVKWPDVRARD